MKIAVAITISIAVNSASAFACSMDTSNLEIIDVQRVQDSQTNLTWRRCLVGTEIVDGACSGTPELLGWNEAASHAKTTPPGDWRIPTLEELGTILDLDCQGVTLPKVFPLGEDTQIWTASPGFPVNDVSAIIDLADGKVWGLGRGVARNFMLVTGFRND